MTAAVRSPHVLPEPPSPVRIGAMSLALAANLAFFFVLSLMRMEAPDTPPMTEDPTIQIVELAWNPPAPVLPPPPMPPVPVRPVHPPKPAPVAQPPIAEPVAPPIESNRAAAEAVPPAGTMSEPASDAVPGPAIAAPAQLAILESSRPPYPPPAIRLRHEGEVLLRIRIGPDGRPVAVDVERSSGFAELDRSAARHVLRAWRFAPPGGDGQAAGLLPVRFSLQ